MRTGIIFGLIAGLAFSLCGGLMTLFIGYPTLAKAKASKLWPTATGVVEESSVVELRDDDGDTMYRPKVVFRYEVDGQEYTSENISYGGNVSTNISSWAKNVVRKYPVDKEIPVHYDPENHAEAALEPGATWKTYLILGFGLIFLLVGILIGGATLLSMGGVLVLIGGVLAGLFSQKGVIGETDRDQFTMPQVNRDPSQADRSADPPQRGDHSAGDDGFGIH